MEPSLVALRAAAQDREQLLVYADSLQARGHPRGELIAVLDAAEQTSDAGIFADARARARALVEAHAILRPPAPGDRGEPTRGVWASWSRGFVRRLELFVDRPSPGRGREEFGGGLTSWAELLAAIMAHPSLALVEHLLLRFDLRGEPLDETAVACDMAIRGLRPWLEANEPRPTLLVDLWTQRSPSPEARERLHAGLPGLRPFWFALDITVVPPPPASPILDLERSLARAGSLSTPFDLLWFDSRGEFLARLGAASYGYQMSLDVYDSAWQVHARRLAEGLGPPLLGLADPLVERRLAHLLDGIAPRLDARGSSFAPRRPWTARPEVVDVSAALRRIATLWGDTVLERLERALLEFDAELAWHWLAEDRGEGEWLGLVGLGDEQLLVLALLT